MAPNKQPQCRTDRHPFLLAVEDVAQQLGTDLQTGLTARQVAELRNEFPPNELEGGEGVSWYKILIKQISNAMILVNQPSYSEFQMMTDSWIGSGICDGSEFRRGRLRRGRSPDSSYFPERLHWILPRVQGREENGLSTSSFITQCISITRWQERNHS